MLIELAVLASVVAGQAPRIQPAFSTPAPASSDITFAEGAVIVLEADHGDADPEAEVDVAWNVVDEELEFTVLYVAAGSMDSVTVGEKHYLILNGPPGRYSVFANVFVRAPSGARSLTLAKLWIVIAPRGPPDPTLPPADPTAARLVVIVYESSRDRLPLAVHRAREEIEKMPRTQFRIIDRDVKTGLGTVPKELGPSLAAATAAGGGVCLVISSGGEVARAMEIPKTWQKIVEEARR